jgi:predicted  nucleic acid-binding Zn-ribbon protein
MDIYYDIDKERQMAGLQSMINGWTIEIQMIEIKIEEIQKQLDNIKNMVSNR